MSVNEADDIGGYVSEEILASETDFGDSDGDVDNAVKKTLFHANDVLSALDKQTRKRMLLHSSDESEPDEGLSFRQRPQQKLSKSLQRKTPTTKRPRQRLSSDKTPSQKDFEKGSSSGNKKSSACGAGTVVDETPKSRFNVAENNPNSTPQTRSAHNDNANIMNTLKEISNTLHQVVKRLDRQESRMECVEKKIGQQSTPPSSSSSAESSKVKIPRIIRSELRSMYRTLMDEDNDFKGYSTDLGVSFKDECNVKVTDRLVREVKATNGSFSSATIRAAAYTYYRSLCQETSLERRGLKQARGRQRRRRERITRKLNSRVSMLQKSTMSERDKTKWMAVLVPGFMSSDHSSDSEDDTALVTQPLNWRTDKVTEFFYQLDAFTEQDKSTQAKKQTKERVLAEEASPQAAPKGKFPPWAVVGSN